MKRLRGWLEGTTRSISAVVRWHCWWDYKIPPLLMVAYLELARSGPTRDGLLRLPLLVLAIGLVASFGYVINDVCDLASDRRAGRERPVSRLPAWGRVALCLGLAAGSLLVPLLGQLGHASFVVVAIDIVLVALYSLPPVRLKVRGLAGVFADAACAHALPTLLFTFVAGSTATGSALAVTCAAVAWSTCYGIRGILVHQIWDMDNDIRAGDATLAVEWGVDAVRHLASRLVFPLELAAFCALAILVAPTSPLLPVLAIVYVPFDAARYRLLMESDLDPAPIKPGLYIPPSDLYEVWLPLALAVALVRHDWRLLLVAVVHALLFRQEIANRGAEAAAIARRIRDSVRTLGRRTG